ncbi:hypothetical protein COL516b_001888 [Colletotrichum fioriniae]|nr:uncharacterized protein COL516b_001888 [Colletotrichum fioriniae]KAJ0311184.1 hypothetical protein COL516b_001888 [Colletotrichum fioriniae]
MTLKLDAAGVLGPDGKSYSFDHRANGYSRGEGFGALVLKRVSDAIRDGDVIRAVIRNSSTNQDGRSPGITQPTKRGQVALIKHVYERANLDPSLTRFAEAHGTGTPVGDPIEASALAEIFAPHRSADEPLYVGALKSNVGHLEGAAGVAAVIKGVLTLESGVIPGNIWFEKRNPKILDAWNLRFPTKPTAWPQRGLRRMSVNSFGVGGSNAHVVMDDALHFLKSFRLVGHHRTETIPKIPRQLDAPLVNGTEKSLEGNAATPIRAKTNPRLAFVFTGQGAQWATMGMDLLAYRAFQESLLAADRYLNDLGFELSKSKTSSRINDPEFCQPICTALQVAMVDLLSTWDVYPHAITGHSSGEVAAAYAAGAISRQAAWKIAYFRGKLSAKLARSASRPSTGMAAVGLSKAATQDAIDRVNQQLGGEGTLEIACMNSVDSHTVSGDAEKIDALVQLLSAEKVFARKLNVEIAYHSQYMRAMADEYLVAMGELQQGTLRSSVRPRFYSSTMGVPILPSQLRRPEYWVKNLVSPVRFTESVTEMLKGSELPKINGHVDGHINGLVNGNVNGHINDVVNGGCDEELPFEPITDFLEIGPHSALKGPLFSTVKQVRGNAKVDYHSLLVRQKPGIETALESVGTLFCHGYNVNLAQVNDADEPHGPKPLMLTNLPSYPFDHSKEYWVQSTLSNDFRKRPVGRHELLGAPMAGFNENNAVWRNYIRLSENPWIEDHKVSGDVLYPAAGMLVMAIEASRQIADKSKVLKGFRLRDVSFKLALRVPDDASGIESQFYLRQHRENSHSAVSTWREFQLWTLQDGAWREHCHGFVQTEYESDDRLALRGSEESIHDGCATEVSVDKLYRSFADSGLNFGPTFQTLSDIRLGRDLNMVATLHSPVDKIEKSMPHQYVQPHLVHPVTLDGLVHANLVALVSSSKYAGATRVPTYLADGWISAQSSLPHNSYSVSAESRVKGRSEVVSDVRATHLEQGDEMVQMSGIVFKTISSGSTKENSQAVVHPAFNVSWKPDPSFLTKQQASQLFQLPLTHEDDPSTWMLDCEALCLAYMRHCTESLSQESVGKMTWYHQRYVKWFQHVVRQHSDGPASESIEELEAKVLAGNASEGKLIIAVGQALSGILTGDRDPLDVIFKDKLAEDVYSNGLGSKRCYAQLCSYLDIMAHKIPNMEILEIGAGTGGATRPAMATLTRDSGRRYGHYDFTDISPSFFEQAKENFKDEVGRMGFRVLNVENDPLSQGFEAGKYDLIIAANVLHATKKIDDTLVNARKLLKPGGKLLLFEITNTEILLGSFCFGTLHGWWLSEDKDRIWGPLMSPNSWDTHLRTSGFSGLDAVFDDFASSPHQMSSILVSSNPQSETVACSPSSYYILTSESPTQNVLAAKVVQSIGRGDCEIETLTSLADKSLANATCVVLSELDHPALKDMNEGTFNGFKRVLTKCKNILWATRGGTSTAPDPDSELVTGLARVVRSERPDVNFLTLSFEYDANEELIAAKCAQVLGAARNSVENSFRVIDDVVHVSRLVQADYMTGHIQNQTGVVSVENKLLKDEASRSLCLQVGDVGQLDSLRFEEDTLAEASLGDHDVECKTMACGVSISDVSSVLGKAEESPLGLEASGIVTKSGPASRFQVGDRVFGLAVSGTMKTHVRSTDGLLAKLPDGVSFTDGAVLSVDYTTAYAVLCEVGSIREGDSVMVHGGCSSIGKAFVQVAQLQGAEVYTTVTNQSERDELVKDYGIPEDHVFSSRDLSMRSAKQKLVKGRGINILVTATDELDEGVIDCIAPFGRIVYIGSGAAISNTRVPRGRNIRLESFDLVSCLAFDVIRTETMFQHMVDTVFANWKNISRPSPTAIYSFSQVGDAFRRMQSEDQDNAKIVLEPRDDDMIPVVPSRKSLSNFDPEASYVIAGGLGGLGRPVARWMASRGAKNLILLSRRGPVENAAVELIAELTVMCDNVVTPACDVTDAGALQTVIDELAATLPPIKGCIQGSMVLQDNLLENMSLDNWKAAVQPKVHASWNLYNALGDKMDFFVFLSSTVGVTGSPEQANYAAGGTFQDAFAHHLVSKGVNAVSIDLPIIRGVGYVAEKPELWDYLSSAGWTHITADELYAVLDYHCRPASASSSQEPTRAQVIPRLWLPQETAAEGYQTQTWGEDPLFSHLRLIETDDADKGDDANKGINHKAHLQCASSLEEAEKIVLNVLLLKIARMLSIDALNLETSKPLHAYGIDSLTAVELRSWLMKELGAEVSVFDITNNSSIAQLAVLAAKKSSLRQQFAD